MQNIDTKGIRSEAERRKLMRNWFFIGLAFLVFFVIILLPTPAGLPVAGQRALGILAFAVILWISEAVTYPVSAFMIVGLISIFIGLAPTVDDPSATYGTSAALRMALGGLASPANALVMGALFIAAAMEVTGLHKRVALYIMSKVGTNTNSLIIGTMIVSTILAFFVPSATARAGAIVPILLGIVAALGLEKNSRTSALMVITAVQSISIWNVGIKTAAAQNMVALGFIQEQFGVDVSWGRWFIAAAPFSIIMCIALFFIMKMVIKPEANKLGDNGKQIVKKQLKELGSITGREIRLIIYAVSLLVLWSTEGVLHPFDSTTVTLVAFALMIMPSIGVFTWKDVQEKVNWGTIIVFGIGISLGTVLLNTQGAQWLADSTLGAMGLNTMPIIVVIAVLSLFNILVHLGFASATSLASALIPIVIGFTLSMNVENPIGLILIQQFVISFGFMLPISAPQNMLAYGTGSFTARDLLKSGIPITIVAYLLILLLSATYWQWIGLI